MKHYLQVTDEHFEKATQNPTQTVHDSGDSGGQQSQHSIKKSEKDTIVNLSHKCTSVHVAEAGLEQCPQTSGEPTDLQSGRAKSDVNRTTHEIDQNLLVVIQSWRCLPTEIKKAILAIINSFDVD